MFIDANILVNNLEGHEDAVWGISVHHERSELLSCSADGSVKLWSPTNLKSPCLSSYVSDQGIKFFLLAPPIGFLNIFMYFSSKIF